jgi:flagella basal body P-ring formation protein FlgA
MNFRPLSSLLLSFAVLAPMLPASRLPAQGDQALAAFRSPPAALSPQLAPANPVAACTVTREQAVAALASQLVEHFNLEGDLQLELVRPWAEPAPAATPITLAIAEFPAQLTSSLMLRVRLESAGSPLGEIILNVRLQLVRDAWVARQPANRGDLVDPAALDVRRIDVLREHDVLPADAAERNLTFARSVAAGRILTWRDVARRALVRKGDLVEVAAIDGPLTVTLKALALQSGAAGETVTVRNLESKKEITAQVVAENRVQVRF